MPVLKRQPLVAILSQVTAVVYFAFLVVARGPDWAVYALGAPAVLLLCAAGLLRSASDDISSRQVGRLFYFGMALLVTAEPLQRIGAPTWVSVAAAASAIALFVWSIMTQRRRAAGSVKAA